MARQKQGRGKTPGKRTPAERKAARKALIGRLNDWIRMSDALGPKDSTFATKRKSLADRAGTGDSVVVRWLDPKDTVYPGGLSLYLLAQATGLSLDWLLFGEGPMYRGQSRDMETLEHDLIALVGRELEKQTPAPAGQRWGVAVDRLLDWIRDRTVADARQALANQQRLEEMTDLYTAVCGLKEGSAARKAMKAMTWPTMETEFVLLGSIPKPAAPSTRVTKYSVPAEVTKRAKALQARREKKAIAGYPPIEF